VKLLPLAPHPLLLQADHWFARAKAAQLGALPCRRGCSRCCIGPFAITILDAAELQRGLAALDAPNRQAIQDRARAQTAAIEAAHPTLRHSPYLDTWEDRDLDALGEQFASLPCPALAADGSCSVYPFRPMTCRLMGIPTETAGTVEGACEVQTAVPIVRLPRALRDAETELVRKEAEELAARARARAREGEEMWLPYGFLPDRLSAPATPEPETIATQAGLAGTPAGPRLDLDRP